MLVLFLSFVSSCEIKKTREDYPPLIEKLLTIQDELIFLNNNYFLSEKQDFYESFEKASIEQRHIWIGQLIEYLDKRIVTKISRDNKQQPIGLICYYLIRSLITYENYDDNGVWSFDGFIENKNPTHKDLLNAQKAWNEIYNSKKYFFL